MHKKNIVEIENVSKKYVIAHEQQNPYASLKEILASRIKNSLNSLLGRSSDSLPANTSESFWALSHINLEIQQGDRLAILGRNGAGKSTLLKLLSRITEPTEGVIRIRGRISSLLEVGTGFHPDLTGRENILLNGAIMGMSYQELKKKFDDIIAFAGVEKFLDTPLKRYSSGMCVRLSFAIAAHSDPDLLIIDEVLAVGDSQFQERCLQKLNDMATQGSTILFVSHNINSVLALCNKGILLEKGELKAFEPIDQCVNRYLRSCPVAGLEWHGDVGNEYIRLYQVALRAPPHQSSFYYQGESTYLDIDCEVLKPHPDLILSFSVLNSRHQPIARSRLCDREEQKQFANEAGSYRLSFHLDLDLFHPGEYQLKLECTMPQQTKVLPEEIVLKFAVYSPVPQLTYEWGVEKDGISLGNRWGLVLNSSNKPVTG